MIPIPMPKIRDLMTGFSFLKDVIPAGQREQVINAAFLDFLSNKDEAAFMEAKANIHPDDSLTLDTWFLEEEKLGHLFRKFVTTHPDKEARVKIILAYAKEPTNLARTNRLKAESVPPEFIRTFRKFLKDKKYIEAYEWLQNQFTSAGEGMSDLSEYFENKLNEKKDKKKAKIADTSNPIKKILFKIWY